jgi:hypothetical protein
LFALLAGAPVFASAVLGDASALAAPKKNRDTSSQPTIDFTGFQVFEDGSSRLSVHLTGTPEVTEKVAGKRAEYVFHGVRIPVRNNKNPLVTRHFSSVVTAARFVVAKEKTKAKARRGRDKDEALEVSLVVDLREAVKPAHRTAKGADGATLFVVDFPKPTQPVPVEPDETPPPKKPYESP